MPSANDRTAIRRSIISLVCCSVHPTDGYDFGMAKTADDLRDEALALSTQDRARLASDLLASLDSDIVDIAEIDRLWSTETQRRVAMLESGEARTVSWDEVQQRFAERRAQRRT
jgi:putative addiction module component (TIGR02574 family)